MTTAVCGCGIRCNAGYSPLALDPRRYGSHQTVIGIACVYCDRRGGAAVPDFVGWLSAPLVSVSAAAIFVLPVSSSALMTKGGGAVAAWYSRFWQDKAADGISRLAAPFQLSVEPRRTDWA